MNVLVSIIIPVYNSILYLDKCLRSVINQSYSNIEIIIVDSGSTDGSYKIAKQYATEDKRVICIVNEALGPANARMLGVEMSTGEYITFIDSDDYVEEDYVLEFVQTAKKNNSELVICGYVSETFDHKVLREVIPKEYYRGKNELWPYRICSSWGRMYLRSMWYRLDVRFVHEEGAIGEDMSVSLLTNAMAKNISVVPKAQYHYVRHDGSIMENVKRGITALFPYEGVQYVNSKLDSLKIENSKDFYYLGLLRFFAKYQLEIGRRLSWTEKKRFNRFVMDITAGRWLDYYKAWHNLICRVELTPKVKVAMLIMFIEIFIWGLIR